LSGKGLVPFPFRIATAVGGLVEDLPWPTCAVGREEIVSTTPRGRKQLAVVVYASACVESDSRVAVAIARYRAMLVASDQITSAMTPGKKPKPK